MEVESIASANRRIGEVKRKMSALGTPNLGAIDEYARVSERYEYLASQRDDVLHARGELESIVSSITNEMTDIFVREFGRINEYFGQTFTEMFGGGKASLVLEDPSQPLECGIEIRVQPPGKQLKTITLLSGGSTRRWMTGMWSALRCICATCARRRSSSSSRTGAARWRPPTSFTASRCRSRVSRRSCTSGLEKWSSSSASPAER